MAESLRGRTDAMTTCCLTPNIIANELPGQINLNQQALTPYGQAAPSFGATGLIVDSQIVVEGPSGVGPGLTITTAAAMRLFQVNIEQVNNIHVGGGLEDVGWQLDVGRPHALRLVRPRVA